MLRLYADGYMLRLYAEVICWGYMLRLYADGYILMVIC